LIILSARPDDDTSNQGITDSSTGERRQQGYQITNIVAAVDHAQGEHSEHRKSTQNTQQIIWFGKSHRLLSWRIAALDRG
jgi:hypothetical protein